MKTLCFDRFGGPEVLKYCEAPDPVPLAHQALMQTEVIGLNFADVYRRKGTYHLQGKPPFIAGYEAVGVVLSAPAGSGFSAGQRVGFADMPFANAERVAVDVDKLIALPDDISFEIAAAVLLQGLTAQYLVRDSHEILSNQSVLVHAAAGGVGCAAIQVARALNARVIAAVGSPEKLELCRELGAADAFVYDELPDDLRVDVVMDPVGGELFEAAVGRLRPLGQLVAIGYAGGMWPELQPAQLVGRNVGVQGVYLGRLLRHAPDVVAAATRELLELWSGRRIRPVVGAEFPLAEVEDAHALVESRRSVGKVVLVP